MSVETVVNALLILWGIWEIVHVRRHRPPSGTVVDRHSFTVMWIAIGAAFMLANLVWAWCQTHHARLWPVSLQALGLGLMGAGIGLRAPASESAPR